MSYLKEAREKLEREAKAGNYDRAAAVMKAEVKKTLLNFAEQNEEFAQAIAQGGAFTDCMKAVAKNPGSGISDLQAYKRAVSFYFPGADIEMSMTVRLEPRAKSEPEPKEEKSGMILDLSAFL